MSSPRRGMVLVIVVVVVAIMSLAGLSYVASMRTEHKAARLHAEQLQLENVVGSGVELLKVFLEQPGQRRLEAGGWTNNPELFCGVPVLEDPRTHQHARFSVVSPRIEQGQMAGIRFGLDDESARLNLGALLRWERQDPGAGRRALMQLPGMTEQIADAILDWIDPDGSPRQFGAEADYYAGLEVPYSPRNAVPQCLEELLLVRGVTRELLFGLDANFNHQVEPEERRAAAQRGDAGHANATPWASLLTVYSAERNRSFDGQPRIWLNDQDLAMLHQRLEAAFDRSWARFIILYRQHGPYQGSEPPTRESTSPLDFSLPARFQIGSVLELVGTKVRVPLPGGQAAEVFASPFGQEPAQMRDYLPRLLDRTTVVDRPVLYGRVNVNLAPRQVLLAVPGMEEGLVDRILGSRRRGPQGDPTIAWLLTEGLVDLARMRALAPYLTAGGDVFRAQVIGFTDQSGASIRLEVVIDAAASPARLVYWKDLQLLGRGYPLASLGGQPAYSPPRMWR